MTKTLEEVIKEYRDALEVNLELAKQEAIIKHQREAARKRLNLAKDELRAMELEILESQNYENNN